MEREVEQQKRILALNTHSKVDGLMERGKE